jgi:tetratricopeptide (TPR) repeat protein
MAIKAGKYRLDNSMSVFLSFAEDNWSNEARALSDALVQRGAQVSLVAEPHDDDVQSLVASQIAEADLMVVLVAPSDETSDWMRDNVRQILQTCWLKPEARVAVVAPAVGAIPRGLRHQTFVRYFAHKDARVKRWSKSPSAVGEFAEVLMQMSDFPANLANIIENTETRSWRNRLVHVGLGETPDIPDRDSIEQMLRLGLDGWLPIVDRALAEGGQFTLEDSRAILDRALIAITIQNSELIKAYFYIASQIRRLSPPEHSLEGNSIDYGLGLVAIEAGNLQAANELLSVALADDERVLGPNHQATIAVRDKFAETLALMGDSVSASASYERALASSELTFGSDHPQTAEIAFKLGLLWLKRGEQTKAHALFDHAVSAYGRVRSEDSKELREALDQIEALD